MEKVEEYKDLTDDERREYHDAEEEAVLIEQTEILEDFFE